MSEFSANRKQLLEENNCCELCGKKKNLEVHHIIPIVCGGTNDIDNLIVVCNVCHTKLTPRKILTKLGIQNLRLFNDLRIKFYEECRDRCEDPMDVYDVFDEVIGIAEKEYQEARKRD